MSKHQIKLWLREAYARLLFHTGLHRVVDRLEPRRLTILFGHCVDAPAINGMLSPDMKIGREKLRRMLAWFSKRYEVTTVADAFDRLRANGTGGERSLVALTMDDGYRDNATELLPLLQSVGVPATVFLESRPLDERRVNWSHKYFWCLDRSDPEDFARRYLTCSSDAPTLEAFRRILEEGGDLVYRLKKVLKYDADRADRDATCDRVFRELGGDEQALCDRLYLTWDQARELRDAGVELGCHTVHHEILSRLTPEEAREEFAGAARSLERELGSPGRTVAYPFGRRWDYDQGSVDAARASGYSVGVMTHAGTNDASTDPFQLHRIPVDDQARMHLLVAEACGGFALLRRFGVNLSE